MPDHGGQAYFSSLPGVDIYTQSNITNIIFTWVHNTRWPGIFFKLARCGYTLRVTSQTLYSPEYTTPTQKKSYLGNIYTINNKIPKATFPLYRIAFHSGTKKHLSDTECTTFRSWAKQHLSVAIIPLKIAFLKGTDRCFFTSLRKDIRYHRLRGPLKPGAHTAILVGRFKV
jgi:hypothetical protein